MMDTIMNTMMNTLTMMSIEQIKDSVEFAKRLGLPIQAAALISKEDMNDYECFSDCSLATLLVVTMYPWIASFMGGLSETDRERFVKFVTSRGGNWEALQGKEITEETVFEAVLGCKPENYYNLPNWGQRIVNANPCKGNWFANYSLGKWFDFSQFSQEELDFIVATDGLIPLSFFDERDKIIPIVEKSDDLERDALIIKAGGLSALAKGNPFGGLEKYYPINLLLKVWQDNCLGLLPAIKPTADALLLQENFWSNCDFNSFMELPSYFFDSWDGYVPEGFVYTSENCGKLRPLTAAGAVYCTQMHTLDVPEWLPVNLDRNQVCNVVFCELEDKRSVLEEQFGAEAVSMMCYNYAWDNSSFKYKDIVLNYRLVKPVEESACELIWYHFSDYPAICADGFHGRWSFIFELAKSDALKRIADIYKKIAIAGGDDCGAVAERISAYFNEEQYWVSSLLLLKNTSKSVHLDLMEAVRIAEEYRGDYPLGVWFLNLLDGNRVLSEDGTRAGIVFDKLDGGVVTYFGGDNVEDVVLGVTGAPYQIIDTGDGYRSYAGISIGNL